MRSVKVYGAYWCDGTRSTRARLDSLGVYYRYFDVDLDARAKRWVEERGGGRVVTPMIEIDGGVLAAPDGRVLEEVLRGVGLMR